MKKQQSNKNKDIFGMAIKAWYHEKDPTDIVVHSPDFDDDVIPVHYLFRDFKEMPPLEKKALTASKGRVLDIGCGAGSHALYLQNNRNLQVTAIDVSPGAVEIAGERGLNDVRNIDFFELKDEKYDTILLLMNGTGIIGRLENLKFFFDHITSLLNPGGKILIDSSNLSYLFDADEDGGIWVDMEEGYYGEMTFTISYKNEISQEFPWLYLDFNTLEMAAFQNGFACKLLKEGEHYDYLAELSLLSKNK